MSDETIMYAIVRPQSRGGEARDGTRSEVAKNRARARKNWSRGKTTSATTRWAESSASIREDMRKAGIL
jgi:hypothetical protein